MDFKQVAQLLARVESVSSRTQMSQILAEFIKELKPDEVQMLSYMIQGRVAPMFVNSEFNYSQKSFMTLLDQYLKGINSDIKVLEVRDKTGDTGDTVLNIWEELGIKSKGLSLSEIYSVLWDIVNISGEGSIRSKNKLIIDTLQTLSPLEGKYFVRIVCGDLRLGLNTKTLLDVFSYALKGDKSLKDLLDKAYGVSADIGYIAKICFESNIGEVESELEDIKCIPGVPVLSRLVERVGSFEEVFERFKDSVLVQPKFDGLRCQIHKWSDGSAVEYSSIWSKYVKKNDQGPGLFENVQESVNVRLFTRNLEDVTEMFPEIVEAAKLVDIPSFVLDSEVIGWNFEKDTFLSYQETMQRRRKYSVGQKSEEIPVRAMVFDVLYLNGDSLVQIDTKRRVEILESEFRDTPEGIKMADTLVLDDIESLNGYFNKSIEEGLEGVIVKQFEGGYKPGFRNFEWIKLKKSMDKTLVDSVDLVVVGFFRGSGRRSELGLGALLGAVYNQEKDTFDAITKIGTGMGDELIKEMFLKLDTIIEKKQPKSVRCDEVLFPDFWVTPKYVISVEADEITKNISDSRGEIGGGMSLRFPRLIEFGRDKNPLDTTSVKELNRMYEISKKI